MEAVTPWRHSMNRVLMGLALNAITLNFLALNYILPAIGLVLMLLGFRSLRRENGWFRACFVITAFQAVCSFSSLILNATILQSTAYGSQLLTVLTALNIAMTFLQFFCLWRAFKAVKTKAGLPANAASAVALMAWYFVIVLLALSEVSGILAGIVMIAAYIFIIRSLLKLSKELDEVGYEIAAAPVRVENQVLVAAMVAILATGITCGYLFGGSYPMKWIATEPTRQAEAAEIKLHLSELGFPAEVLEDLTEADILACKDAQRIVVDVMDHAVNDGRQVIESVGNMTYQDTVYDLKELRITGIAVELSGEREVWKIFHHFRWLVNPGFYGTEALQLWPAYRSSDGWGESGSVTGQVLYTQDGQSYTAAYHSLGSETYTSNSFFWGEQISTDVFATFSMPRNSENQRGYISYSIVEMQDGWIVDSWVNYTHQQSWLQYPARTAAQTRMAGGWNEGGAFFTVQDALQFNPADQDDIEKNS